MPGRRGNWKGGGNRDGGFQPGPTPVPQNAPYVPEGLSQATADRISQESGRFPCIRCSAENHTLKACRTPDPAAPGSVWKDLRPEEKGPANKFVDVIKEQLNQLPLRVAHPIQSTDGARQVNTPQPSQAAPRGTQRSVLSQGPQMPAAKDNPGKYDNEASRRQRQNNQVSLAKAVMNQRLAKLQVGSTGRFDFPPRKEISNPTSQVVTNHFEVRLKNDIKLYEYRLVFTAGTRVRRKIKALVERAIESTDALRLNREHFATDYFDTIIAWKSLDESLGQPIVGTGTTRSWPLTALQDGQQPIAFDLRFERVVDVDTLVNYTQSDPATHNWDHAVVTRALNVIIFDSFVKSNEPTVQIGANKFYLRRAHEDLGQYSKGQLAPISRSLCTIRGYFYTVKPGIDKVLLNVNTATSAFFKPQLVSQLMLDDWTWGPNNIPADQLRGLRVRINYQRGDPKDVETFDRLNSEDGRSKVIENLGESVDRQIFTPKDANGNDLPSTTVANHLLTTYGLTLNRPDLPAVNLGKWDEPRWYAPEHLSIYPYQIYRRLLPDQLVSGMLHNACLKPAQIRALIEDEGLQAMGASTQTSTSLPLPSCNALGMHPRMMQIPSGTLGYPILQYGKNHQEVLKNKYRWDLIEKSFFKTLRPSFSVFLLVGPGVHKSKINICMDRCREYFGSKYSVANMNFVGSNILPAVNIITLDNAMGQQTKQRKFDFAILLLGNKSVDAYAAFKNLCDRKYNAHSLCMTRNTFDGKNWQTCLSNTAMKVNLKATGSNHTIIEKNSKLREIFKNTLVLGADVTHPGPGALMACPSIAAIVGSVDDHAGRFLGSMRLQSRDNKETIDLVRPMVKERIVDWVKEQRKGIMPTNILYYRDGVSESQYTQIRDQELPEIRRAYSEAIDELSEEKIVSKESSAKVNLTAIIVAKRHHVRFFPINPNDKEAVNQNCKPGTYVEQVVTSPYFQDFYLQSHAAIKGTARPAHYFIITEEMNKSVDFYRQLTHELCYTYVRCTLGVSYASPAYYADRLCDRGRHYLRDLFHHTNAGKPHRDVQNKKRQELERRLKQDRIKKYGSEWQNGKKRTKNKEEISQQEKDKRQVYEEISEDAMKIAKRMFYGSSGKERNPFDDRVSKTMFWM